MKRVKDYMILNNGEDIPTIGYGTWLIDQKIAKESCLKALKAGYRHIDSAQAYGNEVGVGEAIRESGIPREEIYLTSKVAAEIKNYEEAKASIEESLRKLNVGYIDLMLIHCPQPWNEYGSDKKYYKENIEVYKALEEFYHQGLIKAIGVSNFSIDDLKHLIPFIEDIPMVNQIPVHIEYTDIDLIKYCQENNIIVEAYSPIAHGRILNHPEILKMSEKYHRSVAEICIRYTLQLNTVSLPKATSLEHIKTNLGAMDFEISEEDMRFLLSLNTIEGKESPEYFLK